MRSTMNFNRIPTSKFKRRCTLYLRRSSAMRAMKALDTNVEKARLKSNLLFVCLFPTSGGCAVCLEAGVIPRVCLD